MIHTTSAYLLALLLAFTGLSLAEARGTGADMGMEIVICAGVTMTTIIVGPDGQPIEETHICPDGSSIFAATFALPMLALPEPRLLRAEARLASDLFTSRNEISPSARSPPALV